MARNVRLHVCFSGDRNEGVAALAREHLKSLPEQPWQPGRFLEDLSGRVGENFGPNGGLISWGMISTRTDPRVFAEMLRPFWEDLLGGKCGDDGPSECEHVIVLYEVEMSFAANAIEIGWDDESSPDRKLVITHHGPLPFGWQQY